MKVSKCSEKKVEAKPTDLSWAEIKKQTGVYRSVLCSDGARWIVIDEATVLLYSAGNLVTANDCSWTRSWFVRTNETVCFELKPA